VTLYYYVYCCEIDETLTMLIMHTVDSEHLYNLQVVLVWEHWHGIFTHTIIATVAMVMVTVEGSVRRPIAGCYQYTRGRYGALCSCSFHR